MLLFPFMATFLASKLLYLVSYWSEIEWYRALWYSMLVEVVQFQLALLVAFVCMVLSLGGLENRFFWFPTYTGWGLLCTPGGHIDRNPQRSTSCNQNKKPGNHSTMCQSLAYPGPQGQTQLVLLYTLLLLSVIYLFIFIVFINIHLLYTLVVISYLVFSVVRYDIFEIRVF